MSASGGAAEAEVRARRTRFYDGNRSALALGLVAVATLLPLGLVALVPDDDLFGLGRVELVVTVSAFFLTMTATTLVGRVIGHDHPRFRLVDLVETGVLHACVQAMVCLSTLDPTPLWFLPVAHAGFMSPRLDAGALKVSAALMLGMTIATLVVLALTGRVASLGLGALVLLLMAGQLAAHRAVGRRLDAYEEERLRHVAEQGQRALHDDRMRIARDLHDGVGAALAAIAWRGHALRPELADAQRAELDVVTRRAEDAMGDLRGVVWALHGPARRWSELVDYLRGRVTEMARGGVEVTVDDLGAAGDPPIEGALSAELLHVVLEGVRNALRHASARRVRVTLDARADPSVVIADDGTGLGARDAGGAGGHGLRSIAERAAAAGGAFDLTSSEAGTTVSVRWPRAG